jgi:hypothetical protein
MLAPWRQPELFLGEVIRNTLAPAEDQNTEQIRDKIRQAYIAVTFLIEPETRLGASWRGT